jgi:F-box-like
VNSHVQICLQLNESEVEVFLSISVHSFVPHVRMSLVSYNPANKLDENVLLVIFGYLDDQDLLRCETVCHPWRNILLSGRPWRTLFHRKIVSSPQWRHVWWELGVDERKLETVHYRELCKAIMKEVNEIDNNWRKRNFELIEDKGGYVYSTPSKIRDDRLADFNYCDWVWDGGKKDKLKFHNRTSMSLRCIVIPDESFAVTNTDIVAVWDKKNLKILDTDGQLISELQELDEGERISWKLASCCLSHDRMAVLSQNDGQEKLSLWNVRDPFKVTRLNSQYFNLDLHFGSDYLMNMDDQFIAVTTFHNNTTSIHLFSMKTLNLHWQKMMEIRGTTLSITKACCSCM